MKAFPTYHNVRFSQHLNNQWRRKIDNWGGGGQYSYIRVHRPLKQLISKEVNNAEHEYMNIGPPPQLSIFLRHCKQCLYCCPS